MGKKNRKPMKPTTSVAAQVPSPSRQWLRRTPAEAYAFYAERLGGGGGHLSDSGATFLYYMSPEVTLEDSAASS